MFLDDLKSYLVGKGIAASRISREIMPDSPDDAIGLFLWAHSTPRISDGSGTRYVQIQCRAVDPDDAYAQAHALVPFLDSGPDEEVIQLTESRWTIARIRSMPKMLKIDSIGRAIYYFEVSLFGDNTP